MIEKNEVCCFVHTLGGNINTKVKIIYDLN